MNIVEQSDLRRRGPAWSGQSQVLVSPEREHAPARRTADEALLQQVGLDDFLQRIAFRDTAFHDPRSHFHRYSLLSDDEAIATAMAIWERTNLANLEENILPTRPRATLILTKGADHVIETVALRRL
jgi:type I pantothenate kinase